MFDQMTTTPRWNYFRWCAGSMMLLLLIKIFCGNVHIVSRLSVDSDVYVPAITLSIIYIFHLKQGDKEICLLTHWGRVTHICVNKLTLLIGPLATNFIEILNESYTFPLKENAFEIVVWQMATMFSRSQCVNLLKNGVGFALIQIIQHMMAS